MLGGTAVNIREGITVARNLIWLQQLSQIHRIKLHECTSAQEFVWVYNQVRRRRPAVHSETRWRPGRIQRKK